MIIDTARCADDQARLHLQLTELARHRFATDQDSAFDGRDGNHLLQSRGNLNREFAGRGHDERGGVLVFHQLGNQGNAERAGFAGAGLRRTQNVTACHRNRNRLLLDRGWLGELHPGQGLHQFVGEAERGKIGHSHCVCFFHVCRSPAS